jgi:hypothetical protein
MATVQGKAMCVFWARIFREFLDMHFLGRWAVRDKANSVASSLNDLKIRIVAPVETVTPQILENTLELNIAWISYVPRQARMLKLFSILQH